MDFILPLIAPSFHYIPETDSKSLGSSDLRFFRE